MELLSVLSLSWLLQLDSGCIVCNWYDVPGGPFGPFGAAAAGAAAAAAAASALNNLLEEGRYAEDIAREQRNQPRGAHAASQEGISDISTAMDVDQTPPPPSGPDEG